MKRGTIQQFAKFISQISLVVFASLSCAQSKPATLTTEMDRLKVHTVLLIPSSAIDEHPVWSPDGRYLVANVMGTWHSLDTSEVQLEPATWREQSIGVLAAKPNIEEIQAAKAEQWSKASVHGIREVTTRSGVKISLNQHELSTRFVVQKKGEAPRTLWRSTFENCHSLALSPDQRFIAFICEQNGVVVSYVAGLTK